jgi:hypothetical protein
MKCVALVSFVGSLILSVATNVRADVLLAAFSEPSNPRGGIAQLNAMSLEPFQDYPGGANGQGDSCWIEPNFNFSVPRLYTSSLNGNLDSFDAFTGRRILGIARTDLKWGGMAQLGDNLLAAYTERASGMSNIRVLNPLTLQDQGPFLLQDTADVICWITNVTGVGIYGSSPEGTIWRFGSAGQILNSISDPAVEWSGLAFAGGRLFASFSNPAAGAGGIRMFEPDSLRDLGNLLTFPPGHQSGPFELRAANDSLYASFLDGSIERYDLSGRLLASINRQGVEWRGLAFAPTAVPEPTSLALIGSIAMIATCAAGFAHARPPHNHLPVSSP